MTARKYRVYATWHVTCPECGEDITDGVVYTRGEAIEIRDRHELIHQAEG